MAKLSALTNNRIDLEQLLESLDTCMIHWSEMRSSKYYNSLCMVCAICKIDLDDLEQQIKIKQRKNKIYKLSKKIDNI